MDQIEEIEYNGEKYISGEFVLKNAPIYSMKCKNTRVLINMKGNTEKDYIYMKLNGTEWKKSYKIIQFHCFDSVVY